MWKAKQIFTIHAEILFFAWSAFSHAIDPQFEKSLFEKYQKQKSSISQYLCLGRLTLTSSTPVTISDVTAATTVYFTPFHGNQIALYDGASSWDLISFTEKSVAVPSTTTTPFDIFGYNNAGTLTLETVDWTNDTTRATALTTQNGVYIKSGATTRRYLGTARTTGVSGQTEDSEAKRFLWNQCNRVSRSLRIAEATNSWSYGTNTWRSANGSTANRVEFILGLGGGLASIMLHAGGRANTGGEEFAAGIGEDSTSAHQTTSLGLFGAYNVAWDKQANSTLNSLPAVGYHYYQWLEIAPSGTAVFYGDGLGASGLAGFIEG